MTADKDKLIPPTFHDVLLARQRLAPYLRPTPVFQSPFLDSTLGFKAYIKCENLQPTGAFKVRGGINLLSQLPAEYRRRGVITASSGNHGQSIAYAGRAFGIPVTVHVPTGTSPLKIRAMENLGAQVVVAGKDYDAAREMAEARAATEGFYYVHSANEPHLIAGVATTALELLETVPELEVLIVPIGAGSGACGAGLVVKTLNPKVQLIGVQAAGAAAVYHSWRTRRLQSIPEVRTFAEGLATRVAFELPFKMLQAYLDDFVLVTDEELKQAIRFLLEMTHMLAEGAGAAATAAALQLREQLAGRHVGIILSGGNMNLERLQAVLQEG